MYKLIVDNVVVDVVKKLRYVRYIPELKKLVVTTGSSAQGVCGSNNKTFYALPGIDIPEEKAYWRVAHVVKISEQEYTELKSALKLNDVVASDHLLQQERLKKVNELSECCNRTITSGFTCMLTDQKQHHFKLTLEDQLNLLDVQRELDEGAEKVVFHATNEVCQAYSRQDAKLILSSALSHKKHQTTYFNILKNCIYNIYDIETIRGITYGDNLSDLPVSISIDAVVEELL